MPLVELQPAEIPPLREAMRDVQMAVATYSAETARGGDLGVAVRGFLASAQVVNDLLTNQTANADSYKALFTQPAPRATAALALIEGVKYARNVAQHVLHIVRPSDDTVLVGGPQIGHRIYAKWAEVPAAAHSQLTNRNTKALKAAYDSALFEKEVVGTMLEVLGFYQGVNPAIVHRDPRGEWTGFPLMDQPGMPDRLHPDEPVEVEAAWSWLDGRVPNGERVVCAQVTFDGTRYLCGSIFTGRHSFAPFAETAQQVERDRAKGATYLEGDLWANVDDVTARVPRAQGPVLFSSNQLDSWASPLIELEREADWCRRDDTEVWLSVVRLERLSGLPKSVAYAVRRARRLNACVPSSF